MGGQLGHGTASRLRPLAEIALKGEACAVGQLEADAVLVDEGDQLLHRFLGGLGGDVEGGHGEDHDGGRWEILQDLHQGFKSALAELVDVHIRDADDVALAHKGDDIRADGDIRNIAVVIEFMVVELAQVAAGDLLQDQLGGTLHEHLFLTEGQVEIAEAAAVQVLFQFTFGIHRSPQIVG